MSELELDNGSTAAEEGNWFRRAGKEVARLDSAVYAAVADTSTPSLDRVLGGLSEAANYSRLSIASAMVLSLIGGRRGRVGAAMGLVSAGVTSAALNLSVKPIIRRRRPDRAAHGVPSARHVLMPSSTAFPSGHSAAAFAFASGVGHVLPVVGFPLRGLAALVAFSRVHTGVHYPGDVLAGALLGSAIAQATTHTLDHGGHRWTKWE